VITSEQYSAIDSEIGEERGVRGDGKVKHRWCGVGPTKGWGAVTVHGVEDCGLRASHVVASEEPAASSPSSGSVRHRA